MASLSLVPRFALRKRRYKKKGGRSKIADQLEFEEGKQPEQDVDSIMDSIVFAEETIDSRPPGLYYLIHWKGETHAEDTWELVERIAHLGRLLKKYHSETQTNPLPPLRLWIKALHHLLWQRIPAQKSPLPLSYATCSYKESPTHAQPHIGTHEPNSASPPQRTTPKTYIQGLNPLRNTNAQHAPCKS